MLTLNNLLEELQYTQSEYYCRDEEKFKPEMVHWFRSACEAGGDGLYVFQTNPDQKNPNHRPVVLVAEATDENQARIIHQRIWNLGSIPFLLIVLPHQIRVYTGFDYSASNKEQGILRSIFSDRQQLADLLAHFSAEAIDTGKIWKSRYAEKLVPRKRVDTRLLHSLETLKKILQEDKSLSLPLIHALIGKYVYIHYLWDRNIITERWLEEQGIEKRRVLERDATVQELSKLVSAMESRFNGKIFPIDFASQDRLKDSHVSMIASVFQGDSLYPHMNEVLQQLHLEFQAYDFCYIPVETLSAVYEQFIENREEKGAFYTPEILADYILSEVHVGKPLQKGMKILDPACGSGIFLVLVYRRLIEQERARHPEKKLLPEELKNLLNGIYGIEREEEACYVAEFSLILTLLHYIDPPELEKHPEFQFPCLHNTHIFAGNFFDETSDFWKKGLLFDCVVGNPPWIKAKKGDDKQIHAYHWIKTHTSKYPVGRGSIAEAFSWRVMDVLYPNGIVGLLLPATSLVNIESRLYRQAFFQKHEVLRITNFANLRDVLFKGRRRTSSSEMPAASFVYRKPAENRKKPDIVHCSPLSINQYPGKQKELLSITLSESDIQFIDPYEAEQGKTSTWKFALLGTLRDKRAIERMCVLFPINLGEYCKMRAWGEKLPRPIEQLAHLYPITISQFQKDRELPQQGVELRENSDETTERLEKLPELRNMKTFNTKKIKGKYPFSMSQDILEENKRFFVRLQGGKTALRINLAPHIILSKDGILFFIVMKTSLFHRNKWG